MTRYLVTGATGGLGKTAVHRLRQDGATVRATGRDRQVGGLIGVTGAQFVAADLARADRDQLARLLDGVDVVWHCAALTAPSGPRDAFMAANTQATINLLDAAAAAGVRRFVYVSSPVVYFNFRHRYDVCENDVATACVNAYAESKLMAEEAVVRTAAACQMQGVILRPRALFGPHDRVLLPRLLRLRRACGGLLPLPRAGRTVLDLTYMDNVVHAMHLASTADLTYRARVYNISNGDPQPLGRVISKLFQAAGRHCGIVGVPYPLLAGVAGACQWIAARRQGTPAMTRYGAGALAFDMTLDIGRARDELGYRPVVPMDDAIRHTADWIRRHDG